MTYFADVPLGNDHPLALELAGLRNAVARFQDEAHTASVKLQRHSLETTRAYDRAQHLERENVSLKAELAVLRANPHPDVSNGATNANAASQVQQLTLSLRRLSDQLSLTEDKLATRTAELTHAKSDVAKVKLAAESAYELAARIRGREEAGKVRERELEWKVRSAQEEAKMSDLAVREYADLVRALEMRLANAERPSMNEQSPPPVPEKDASSTFGLKTGVENRLEDEYELEHQLAELQKEMEEMRVQLDRVQADLAASESKLEAERKSADLDRTQRAKIEFELEKMRTDDTTAAKMVSRYMKFSQTSNNTLQTSLSALQARHVATLDTLHSQIYALSSELHTAETQNDRLRSALDELGGEMMKEMYGRRSEVALRIKMLNREEKIQEGLKRWLRKMEEAISRSPQSPVSPSFSSPMSNSKDSQAGAHDALLMSSQDARILLTTLEDGPVTDDATLSSSLARIIMAQNTIDQLVEELAGETQRRLELELLLPLAGAAPASAHTLPLHDPFINSSSETIGSTDKMHINGNGFHVPLTKPPAIDIKPKSKPTRLPLPAIKFVCPPGTPAVSTGGTVQPPSMEGHMADLEARGIGEDRLIQTPSPSLGEGAAEEEEPVEDIPEIPGGMEANQDQNQGECGSQSESPTTPILIPTKAITPASTVNSTDAGDTACAPVASGPAPANSTPIVDPSPAENNDQHLFSTSTESAADECVEVQTKVDDHPPLPIEVSPSDLPKEPNLVHILEIQTPISSVPPSTISDQTRVASKAQDVGTACITTSSDVRLCHSTEALSSMVGTVVGSATSGTQVDTVRDSETGAASAPIPLNTSSGSLCHEAGGVSSDPKGSIPHDTNLHLEDHRMPVSNVANGSPTGQETSIQFESEKVEMVSPIPQVVLTPHPLLEELARVSKRYDELQRAFRDCHLALETLKASLPSRTSSAHSGASQPNVIQLSGSSSKIPPEVLHSALERLDDFTEDARVELEIKTSDEILLARGYETLLSVPGALSSSPDLSSTSQDGYDHDLMPTQSETELQIRAFISGTDINVKRNQETFARKLQDVQHDIAALKRAVHEPEVTTSSTVLSSPPSNGAGWTSWIRSPSSASSIGSIRSVSAAVSPTFGNIMTSPMLGQSPSMNFHQKKAGVDPLASLGLRIAMPKFSVVAGGGFGDEAQQTPTRARPVSAMYMLGLGSPPGTRPRMASGTTLGLRNISSPTMMRPLVVSATAVGDNESEAETDVESSDDGGEDNNDVE